MKKQRFLHLMGVVTASAIIVGVLFMVLVQNGLLPGKTAVSPDTAVALNQVVVDDDWLATVSEELEAVEYAFARGGEAEGLQVAYQAPNRAQNLRAHFFDTGIEVGPRLDQGDDWRVGLDVIGLANGLQLIEPQLSDHRADGNRVTLDYGQWQAWYVNDVRGIEQGFTIEAPLFTQKTGMLQIDMAVTGDLKPQFVSDDEVRLVTAVGDQILTYQKLVAFDAQGSELPADMEVITTYEGQPGIRLVVNVAEAEYPIVVDPLLGGGADWVAWIEEPDTNFGFSVSTAGDVNDDGFDDVLVGAHWFDGGAPDTGAVFGYYGGPDGLLPSFQWKVEGSEPGMEFGYAVNPAGDINNDGYADVIVGTHMTPTGKAFVYSGSFAGLGAQPIWIGIGEQDDDGFGTAVNTAGDVNNDGVDDIIIGAPYFDGDVGVDSGRAYVFHGPISQTNQTPDWYGEGGAIDFYEAGGLFGFSVGTAGDVNQDEFDDVIIGEPLGTDDGDVGVAVIFGGSPTGLFMPGSGEPARRNDADWISYGPYQPGSQYGAAVGHAGDINGDGFDDVVVGAPYYSNDFPNMGAMFVFTGTNLISDMVSAGSPFPPWGDSLGTDNALFGYSVGTAGDVDQDGYDDVIIGAPQFDNGVMQLGQVNAVNGGAAFVLRGSPSGFVDSLEISSNVADAKFGTSVGTAGDVNQDGYADIVVGAPTSLNFSDELGEAYSFYGSGAINNLQAFNDSPTNLGNPTKLRAEIGAGGVLNYDWDLGDGTIAAGPMVEYVYPQPGYYTAVVTGTSFTDQLTATTAVTISQSSFVDPINGGSVEFVNEETGFGTKMEIPPGAVSNTFKISYTPLTTITQPSPENSLGYYFDLNDDLPDYQLFLPVIAKGDGNVTNQLETAVTNAIAAANTTESIFFNTPVTVTIVYTDTDLTEPEELSLKLLYWNEELQEWIDIAEECGLADTYVYYPDQNYYTVQVCHLSRFGVAH